MKRFKEDIKTIIELITFGLVYLSVLTIDNPVLCYIFLGIWVVYWGANVYSKIQYRKGNAEYLLVPTINDEYSKMTSIILGIILITLGSIFAFWMPNIFQLNLIMFIVGILLFINGILDLPKGRIESDGKILSITGLKEKIEIKNIETLEIITNKIIITDNINKVTRIDNFNLDLNYAERIRGYLLQKNNGLGFVIKNKVE